VVICFCMWDWNWAFCSITALFIAFNIMNIKNMYDLSVLQANSTCSETAEAMPYCTSAGSS
jgi:hypothetical protein